jgi:hypothetical protein
MEIPPTEILDRIFIGSASSRDLVKKWRLPNLSRGTVTKELKGYTTITST